MSVSKQRANMSGFFDYSIPSIMSKNIKRMDAVKVTSVPQIESFWVEINSVDGDMITGSVQNNLTRPHSYELNDIISFDKKNVKEHKEEAERFNLSNLSREAMIRLMLAAANGMNANDFDRTLNIRMLPSPAKRESKQGRKRK